MQPLAQVTVDQALATVGKEHVQIVKTKPDPKDNRLVAETDLYHVIRKMLVDSNLASENQYTIVIDVQGTTENGRIIQCAVLDTCLGPLEFSKPQR